MLNLEQKQFYVKKIDGYNRDMVELKKNIDSEIALLGIIVMAFILIPNPSNENLNTLEKLFAILGKGITCYGGLFSAKEIASGIHEKAGLQVNKEQLVNTLRIEELSQEKVKVR